MIGAAEEHGHEAAAPADERDGFSLLRQGTLAFTSNAFTLAVTVVTGIMVARLLGASGRGELTAILTVTGVIGYVFTMGCGQAAEFHQARRPEEGGRLIGTWLMLLVVLGALSVVVAEVLLPVLLAAQTAAALHLAQLYVLSAPLLPLSELLMGVLLGDQDFTFFNVFRVVQPGATAVLYLAMWLLHAFTLPGALLATLITSALGTVVIALRAVGRHGVSRPSLALARSTLWYGFRAHGNLLASVANLRLDLFIIPAFLTASAVGLYAVATSVSWAVVTVSSNLATVVLAAAARQGVEGSGTIIRSLQLTVGFALGASLALALLADLLLPLVYGNSFKGSSLPLRLLLPGSALYASATLLWSGLYAANRPFTAAVSQFAGLAVTTAGLLLFLRSGGIVAAALVSTASYSVIFLVALVLYRRVVGIEWSALVPSWKDVAGGGASALRRAYLRGRFRAMDWPWRT